MSLKCSSDDGKDHVKDCTNNFEDKEDHIKDYAENSDNVSETKDCIRDEYDNEWNFQRELDNLESSPHVSLKNLYIQGLMHQSALYLLQPLRAKKALEGPYEKLGLFFLFFMQTYLEIVCKWTNKQMIWQGFAEITKEELLAYLGLEMGMSLVRMNEIKEY